MRKVKSLLPHIILPHISPCKLADSTISATVGHRKNHPSLFSYALKTGCTNQQCTRKTYADIVYLMAHDIPLLIQSFSSCTSCNLSYLILVQQSCAHSVKLIYIHKYNTPYRKIHYKSYGICSYDDLRLTRKKHLKLLLS